MTTAQALKKLHAKYLKLLQRAEAKGKTEIADKWRGRLHTIANLIGARNRRERRRADAARAEYGALCVNDHY